MLLLPLTVLTVTKIRGAKLESLFKGEGVQLLFPLVIITMLWESQAAAEAKEGYQTFSFKIFIRKEMSADHLVER